MPRPILPVLLILPGLALAAPLPAAAAGPPPSLAYLQEKGVKLTYLGKDGDVAVWLGEHDGQMQYFSVLPDGRRAMAGILLDSTGRDLTADLLSRAVAAGTVRPAPAAAPAGPADPDPRSNPAAAVTAAAGTHWLSFGHPGGTVVYMLADPECPYCRLAWTPMLKMARDGRIELRVIPVGFIHGQESMARLVSILAAPSPARAWDSVETGGAIGPASSTESILGIVRDNHDFASRYSLQSTPAFLWNSASGPHVSIGMPTGADGNTDLSVFLR